MDTIIIIILIMCCCCIISGGGGYYYITTQSEIKPSVPTSNDNTSVPTSKDNASVPLLNKPPPCPPNPLPDEYPVIVAPLPFTPAVAVALICEEYVPPPPAVVATAFNPTFEPL